MNLDLNVSDIAKQTINELITKCNKKFNSSDIKLIDRSIELLLKSTNSIERSSGEDYVLHPVRVATIALDTISLGRATIVAAILHDAIQDEYINIELVKNCFGNEEAHIISGLIKISTLYTEKLKLNSDNFITLLLSIVSDVRIILLKIADRLDNIRNIRKFTDEKQLKIAQEARLLYAPIAHRLGLYHIKSEFEDISLRHIDPKWYYDIAKQLKDTKKKREDFIEKFTEPIKTILEEKGIDFDIKGRPKSVNSIYGKIKKQNIDISEIFDLFAIRIILNNIPLEKEKEACWNIYSLVTNIYTPNPNRLRDWISTPRPSGYESLHTTVMGQDNNWVEIQIRTTRMDEVAEKGGAAHWKYKESGKGESHDDWLRNVRDVLENKNMAEIDNLKNRASNKVERDIFIFTPQGDIKKLTDGATILDFAYSIHTKLGNQCTGARVNEKIESLKYKLKNGDTVEIISSKNQHPRTEWLNIVASNRAKAKIRRSLSELQYKNAEVGKEILERKISQLKFEFNDSIILKIINHFKYKRALDFYQDLADDKFDIQKIKDYLINADEEKESRNDEINEASASKYVQKNITSSDFLVIDKNLANIDYKLAKCCRPIPGDNIFGFVTINRGIQIHRNNCPNAPDLKKRYGYRVVPASWTEKGKDSSFLVEIIVTGVDKIGIVNHISEVISKNHQVNMRSIAINTKDGIFQGFISIFVNSLHHLDILLTNINKIKGVLNAERLDKQTS